MEQQVRWAGVLAALVLVSACGGGDGGGGGGAVGGDGGGGSDGGTQNNCTSLTVSANITADTTWGEAGKQCTVTVSRKVNVEAALTIRPGTTVTFGANAGLHVMETGSLTAVGTSSARIVFRGTQEVPGAWAGIAIRSNDPDNRLAFVDVRHAGAASGFCCDYFYPADIVAAVVLQRSARLTLEDSVISQSASYGLFVFPTAFLQPLARNTFAGNTRAPVVLPFSLASSLDTASDYSGDAATNVQAFVALLDGNDDASDTEIRLRALDVPYRVYKGLGSSGGEIEMDSNVVVEAGARLVFEPNVGLEVMETGSLSAVGTATARVTFTGREQAHGYWRGLAFRSNTTTNRLSFVDVLYAGAESGFCCDYFEGSRTARAALIVGANGTAGRLGMDNSTVSFSANWGIYRFSTSTFSDGGGNTYEGNTSGNQL